MLYNQLYYSPISTTGGSLPVITASNYTYYVLLQIDGEISTLESKELQLFLQTNPQYKAEVNALKSVTLTTSNIAHPNISSLLKLGANASANTSAPAENLNNICEALSCYIDNEVTLTQQLEIEMWLQNPAIQANYNSLLATKLEPVTMLHPNKSKLLKTAPKAVPLNYYKYAAIAAGLALILGITITQFTANKILQPIIVSATKPAIITNNSIYQKQKNKYPVIKPTPLNNFTALATNNTSKRIYQDNKKNTNNNTIVNTKLIPTNTVTTDLVNRTIKIKQLSINNALSNDNKLTEALTTSNYSKVVTITTLPSLSNSSYVNTTLINTNSENNTNTTLDDVSIANIPLAQLDKNQKINKLQARIKNIYNNKLKNKSFSSIIIGRYEIALAQPKP